MSDERRTIITDKPGQTESIGEQIGRRLRGGEVIELAGDLGSGKTTFVHGLARGMGSKDKVASPTFTISRVYDAPNASLHHFDFYRLSEPGLMKHELSDVLADPTAVVVVEWADIASEVLPDARLRLSLSHEGGERRRLELVCPAELKYLEEDVDTDHKN